MEVEKKMEQNSQSLNEKKTFIIEKVIKDNDLNKDSYITKSFIRSVNQMAEPFINVLYSLIINADLILQKGEHQHYDYSHRNYTASCYYVAYGNTIYWDFRLPESLHHETGHALDSCLGNITHQYLIKEFNNTFDEIILDELKTNYKSILDEIFDNYRDLFDSKLGPGSFDRIKPLFYKHSKLYTYDEKRRSLDKDETFLKKEYWVKERLIYKELLESGYVSDMLKAFDDDLIYYSYLAKQDLKAGHIVIDILSVAFNFKFITDNCGHGPLYYEDDALRIGEEVFAELYALYNPETGTFDYRDPLFKKYFPKTIKAFKLLREYAVNRVISGDCSAPEFQFNDDYSSNKAKYHALLEELDRSYYGENYEIEKAKELTYPSYCTDSKYSYENNQRKSDYLNQIDKNLIETPDYKEGMMVAFRLKKDRGVLALSREEQIYLSATVRICLWHRHKTFKYMFGEKFKYQPYYDFQKSKNMIVPSYVALYILNKQLDGKLIQFIERKALRDIERGTLSQESFENIKNALQF